MILAPEVGRALHYSHRGGLLYDTNQGSIPTRIPADGARLLLGQIAALLTGPDPLAYRCED
jgi:hypothetical protein